MAKKAGHPPDGTARERLLTAANQLFYDEGVHTVGIDRVIERAGVAKASLYNTFGSKEELIRVYLETRHQRRKDRIAERIAQHDNPRDRLLSVFDLLGDLFADPGFRGCPLVNASAEAAGGKIRKTCRDSRAWTRALFTELSREAGAADPERLAQQLVILHDGATVSAQMERDLTAASTARAIAATLLDAACPPRASARAR
jgi:AcrR family transcriptional regulator